jgi:hypothetical protein
MSKLERPGSKLAISDGTKGEAVRKPDMEYLLCSCVERIHVGGFGENLGILKVYERNAL